ncbi:MAG: sulfatase [Planctomycetota bacterium]
MFRYFCVLATASLCSVASATPNVLLICVDDLRPELGCYGVEYVDSPHIDRLAAGGRRFVNHFVQSPTCGASRFALLTGCYGPGGNHGLFRRADAIRAGRIDVTPSLPALLRTNGYTTVSVGKVSHHPGGRGGKDWDDGAVPEMPESWDRHLMPVGPWRHPRGAMHGLADGEIRDDSPPGGMAGLQSAPGDDATYPDGLIADEALRQLDELDAAGGPFLLAVGFIRPHLAFGAPERYMAAYAGVELPPIPHPVKPRHRSTWHKSGEFRRYDHAADANADAAYADEVRRHYAACVSYADAQVGKLLDRLDELGLADDTVVVLWGDHGWHLGEHAIWGKHCLFDEALRSPLIVRVPGIAAAGEASPAFVATVDVYPTLCDLLDVAAPPGLAGESLVPQLARPAANERAVFSYHTRAATLRGPGFRYIEHDSGATEYYVHAEDDADAETRNLAADFPEEVARLSAELDRRQSFRLRFGD